MKIIQSDNSKELTLKVLMYLAHCQERGFLPTSLTFCEDSNYLYSLKIVTKEAEYEPVSI